MKQPDSMAPRMRLAVADDVPTAAPTTTPNKHVQATRGGRGGVGVKRVVDTCHASHIKRYMIPATFMIRHCSMLPPARDMMATSLSSCMRFRHTKLSQCRGVT